MPPERATSQEKQVQIFVCGLLLTLLGGLLFTNWRADDVPHRGRALLCFIVGVSLLITTRQHLTQPRSWSSALMFVGAIEIVIGLFVRFTGHTGGMTSHAVEAESGYVFLGLGLGLTTVGFLLSLVTTPDPRERWRKFSSASIFAGLITLFFGLVVGLTSTDTRALAPYVLVGTGAGAMLLGSLLWRALSR